LITATPQIVASAPRMNHRIIARLDIKGPNLVKGIRLEGLRALGPAERFARHYYETGADELIYADVVASLYNRNSLADLISRTARQIHIPLTVGGGIRSIQDINTVLRAGADKVSLNTAAIARPETISEAARIFGSSTIVVTIEVIRQPDGRYLAYTDNGREPSGLEAVTWARRAEELGAGEIVLTSVDRDGTGKGFDLDIVTQVTQAVSIPVIAHGGAGQIAHLQSVLTQAGASAVAIASMIHYDAITCPGVREPTDRDAPSGKTGEGNFEFLKSGRGFSKVTPLGFGAIKHQLRAAHVPCRPGGHV
jgi:imidazole glycerol-phosphate synthase subunit HisF